MSQQKQEQKTQLCRKKGELWTSICRAIKKACNIATHVSHSSVALPLFASSSLLRSEILQNDSRVAAGYTKVLLLDHYEQ